MNTTELNPQESTKLNFFPVINFEMLLTEKCNLACSYCFETSKDPSSIPMEAIDAMIEQDLPFGEFYPFGGEPMLSMDFLKTLISRIKDSNVSSARKENLVRSLRFLITNGTQIEKHLDYLVQEKIQLQVSLDGPKEVNDLARVYGNGKGTFDEVLRQSQLGRSKGLKVSFHGAIAKENYGSLFDIFKFFFEQEIESRGSLDGAIQAMGENVLQLLFEDDLTDEDIDTFLMQMFKICEWIMTTEEFSFTTLNREQLLAGWLLRRGSRCIAGNRMMVMDTHYNLYPCHRYAVVPDRAQFSLGSVLGPRKFRNFAFFNTLLQLNYEKKMYSTYINNNDYAEIDAWLNWCPAANRGSGISSFHLAPKASTLIAELQSFVLEIAEYYQVDIVGRRESMTGNNNNQCVNSNGGRV